MREKIVILTREEMDALTKYDKQIKQEAVKAIFDDVKELLELRYRFEDKRGENADRTGNYYYPLSEHLITAGYRKSTDLAEEIFAEIERMCIDTFGNFNHRVFAELKKKYTGEGK